MQNEDGLSPAERDLESALRSLAPAAARIDAVSAAFEAGRRSSRRQLWLWQSAAAALLLVSVSTWMTLAVGYESPPAVPGHVAVVAYPPRPLPEQSVAMLQRAVREGGFLNLPPTPLPDVRSIRARDVL